MHPIEQLVQDRAPAQKRLRIIARRKALLTVFALVAICLLIVAAPSALRAWDYSKLGVVARAAFNGQSAECLRLVKGGAAIDETNDNGETALSWAVYHCDVATTRTLVELGADVDHANHLGYSPLMLTATPLRGKTLEEGTSEQRTTIARLLIEHGADVNLRSSNGKSALHFAALHGNADLIRILLDGGANPSSQDSQGFTPLDLAEAAGNQQAATELRRLEN